MALLKRWRFGLLGLAVSLLAVYFIVSQIDLRELGLVFSQVRWGWVVLCVLLLVLGLATRAWRWRVLLSEGLPLGRAFSIMNVAYLVNGILPLRIGEVARAYLATRSDPPVPVFKSVSTIIVERLLDLLAVVGLVALALAFGPLPDELRVAALLIGPLALVGFLALVFLAGQRALARRLVDGAARPLPAPVRLKLPALADHFLDGLMPLSRGGALVRALALTALSWALSVAAGYVLMRAIWDTADLAATCLFIAAASLAIAVPAVPGNVGTMELSVLLALQATGYGEPASMAGAFAILLHAVNLATFAVLGAIGLIHEGITLEQLSRGVQGMQPSKSELTIHNV